jgi:heat shock protein HslJ
MELPFTRAGAVVALALVVASCGDDGSGDDDDDGAVPQLADLSGRTFTSTSVEGWTVVDGTAVILTFDDEGVSAIAGCNTMRGGAAITDGALAVADPMASTMMACSEELTAQDEWLQAFLTAGPTVALDAAELTLATDEETLVASS